MARKPVLFVNDSPPGALRHPAKEFLAERHIVQFPIYVMAGLKAEAQEALAAVGEKNHAIHKDEGGNHARAYIEQGLLVPGVVLVDSGHSFHPTNGRSVVRLDSPTEYTHLGTWRRLPYPSEPPLPEGTLTYGSEYLAVHE